MREAIGGTWIFQIVIVFILLFTGFMCLSINRSKAFNVKDKIIQTIQSYNGMDLGDSYQDGDEGTALSEIVTYMQESSYRTTGIIPDPIYINDEEIPYTCYTRDGKPTSTNPVFCVAKIDNKKEGCAEGGDCFDELPSMSYYRVVVFYQLDLPVFHDLFNFKIVGDTKTLYGGII